jgi:hypothetical protein
MNIAERTRKSRRGYARPLCRRVVEFWDMGYWQPDDEPKDTDGVA